MGTSAIGFIHELTFDALPKKVIEQAKLCVLDLLGVALAGRQTALSRIAGDHAAEFFAPGTLRSRMLFDGRVASPVGAGLAGAMTIDSCDGHDGHAQTKGHVGVTVLPALLALADAGPGMRAREFITCIALGYELGTRAGIALHASACDYHTSGAWNALAAAALAARILPLDMRQTREALGIAEYHGPRSQMMRCIDHPTMVKDGSGWGCMAGLSAAFLAQRGFTGAPALTIEQDSTRSVWSDLGERWRIMEQYFKPQPVCRWAHPAIDAALALKSTHGFSSEQVRAVTVRTFHHATRLAHAAPASTEEAQYSLLFPVAVALKHGAVRFDALHGEALGDAEVLRLSHLIRTEEDTAYTSRFPNERIAEMRIELFDGRVFESGPTQALGDPDLPLAADAIRAKFRAFAQAACGASVAQRIESAVDALDSNDGTVTPLLDLVLAPVRADA
ncbi:2-methylcitrate dehydratase (plasmid) [Burkholderia sp. SFA1]|uniref:MmgE/PrpD family protein n=1 Tax=unclassified Caballeronia TaxID=2646786 RepID=UPI001F23ED92|nr:MULTISPECIES: MmgE/PrpD family protein [unclassified Caballeronia]MCE4547191.1 MmgE/PrpD family protein [Caballeronia sp. PC1]MCE4572335.1 MmgE/PrpD family protein [Caballeronia sp. CLC5]BBQ00892.1 2-methylcitrate dehydratase [Burkholderia sp. SFA1]